jgi:hypothetical protein
MKKQMVFILVLILTLLARPPGEAVSTALQDETSTQVSPGAAPAVIYADDLASVPQKPRSATVGASTVSADDGEGAETAAFNADVHGVTVDIYQNMESGNDGDLLTPEIMNASTYGGIEGLDDPEWELDCDPEDPDDGLWVSTSHARELPGIVTVNGINYSGESTRTWRFRNKYQRNRVAIMFGSERQWNHPPYHDRITIAAYFTTYQTSRFGNQHDSIVIGGPASSEQMWGAYCVLQTSGDYGYDPPYINAHSAQAVGDSTRSPDGVKVEAGKTYWVNMHYDGVAGECKVAVFDPDNNWVQVGDTVVADGIPGSQMKSQIKFGRVDSHSDWPDNETQSYFGHILIDYTNAAFPLLPVPDLALHGAPADEAIHLDWAVGTVLPVTSTWYIDYYTQTASVFTATDPLSITRSTVLTENVTNYQWYTVTLHAMDGATSILSDTVRVMPTDKFVYLPLVMRAY